MRGDSRNLTGMPTADEIFGRYQVLVPGPSSRAAVLAISIEMLPTIQDDMAADLIQILALALVDRDEELRAVRSVLSAALEHAHKDHVENSRLQRRLAVLLYAGRRERTAA